MVVAEIHIHNTAVGYIALQNVTTGNGNTALGDGAGTTVTTGGNNLCLGYGAATNRTVGYNASATADNSTVHKYLRHVIDKHRLIKCSSSNGKQ